MDLEVTHPIRYHQKRVVHLQRFLNVKVRVVPVQRCNSASKLLEYLLHLPYPVLYEGMVTLSNIIESKRRTYMHIYLSISAGISVFSL